MTPSETIIHITPQLFVEREKTLVEAGSLSASTFHFDSGVCGLRLKNDMGHLVTLPFQGQQIWSAEFGGRNLTMKSMFAEPRPTRDYLQTYGGFLLCALTTRRRACACPVGGTYCDLPLAATGQTTLTCPSRTPCTQSKRLLTGQQ